MDPRLLRRTGSSRGGEAVRGVLAPSAGHGTETPGLGDLGPQGSRPDGASSHYRGLPPEPTLRLGVPTGQDPAPASSGSMMSPAGPSDSRGHTQQTFTEPFPGAGAGRMRTRTLWPEPHRDLVTLISESCGSASNTFPESGAFTTLTAPPGPSLGLARPPHRAAAGSPCSRPCPLRLLTRSYEAKVRSRRPSIQTSPVAPISSRETKSILRPRAPCTARDLNSSLPSPLGHSAPAALASSLSL